MWPVLSGPIPVQYGADKSGAPGAAQIDAPAGRAAIAIGAAAVVITNNQVKVDSIVLAELEQNDATLTHVKSVIPAAGSFTVTGNANATAAAKFRFVVFQPIPLPA